MLHAVVMAGGSGTRFWPMSRRNRPKHLLPLAGPLTLIQRTMRRIAPMVPPERTWVITGSDHAEEVRQQLPELPPDSIIAEPCRRDTAPCIGLAAAIVCQQDSAATLVVMPADHVIEPEVEFRVAIDAAVRRIGEDPRRLITLGIKPHRPATGYGYIHRGAALSPPRGPASFAVRKFTEKPARELAEQFVRSGEYYWNSGIFVWSAATISDELRSHRPQLAEALDRVGASWRGASRDEVLAMEYNDIQPISIDYAVLEHARNVVVIEAAFQWDDVGSWGAIQRLVGCDATENTVVGPHCGVDTRGNIIMTDAEHLVATLGVENLVIVHCGNATLVAHKDQEESVKRLVDLIRQQGHEKYL